MYAASKCLAIYYYCNSFTVYDILWWKRIK